MANKVAIITGGGTGIGRAAALGISNIFRLRIQK